MLLKKKCLSYLELEKIKPNEEFPKYEITTEELFVQVSDFVNKDFEGIPENKIYRLYLKQLKDMICYAFNNNVSKASFFKKLNNKNMAEYLTGIMKNNTKKTIFLSALIVVFCLLMAVIDGVLKADYFVKSIIKLVLFLI